MAGHHQGDLPRHVQGNQGDAVVPRIEEDIVVHGPGNGPALLVGPDEVGESDFPCHPPVQKRLLVETEHLHADGDRRPGPVQGLDHVQLEVVVFPLVVDFADEDQPGSLQLSDHPGKIDGLAVADPFETARPESVTRENQEQGQDGQ